MILSSNKAIFLVGTTSLAFFSSVSAFVPSASIATLKSAICNSNPSTIHFTSLPKLSSSSLSMANEDDSSILSQVFTGGAFDKEEAAAIKIASKIRTVKDLGWTAPAKRRGNTRPKHRAWGGEDEVPVQDKPNYDETKEKCVEKWLSQDELESKTRCAPGPASDTVFVALAGGASYAERDVVEKRLKEWRSPDGRTFNEAAFLKSVTQGRTELALGWVAFLVIVLTAATNIAFPDNPLNMALVDTLDPILADLRGKEI